MVVGADSRGFTAWSKYLGFQIDPASEELGEEIQHIQPECVHGTIVRNAEIRLTQTQIFDHFMIRGMPSAQFANP